MHGAALVLRLPLLCLVLAALLTGCGQAKPADDNYGYGWSYDVASPSGLRLRYQAGVDAGDRAPIEVFEAAYAETQACVTVATRGPLVVVVPRGSLDGGAVSPPPGAHVGGLYYFDTDLVVVTETLSALRHELVHYLLDRAGFSVDRNRAHDHPAFSTCVGPTLY